MGAKYKKQVKKNKYTFKYNNLERFCLYWHQIYEVLHLAPRNVLEVGCANKVVTSFIKNHNIDIETFDIDPDLKPDYLGSVTEIDKIVKKRYSVVLLGEILEHIEYADFLGVLKKLHKIADALVVTLPYPGHVFKFSFKIPFLKEVTSLLKIPKFYAVHRFDGEHYWEIGKRGFTRQKVLKDIQQTKWKILKRYTVKHSPGHKVIVLTK